MISGRCHSTSHPQEAGLCTKLTGECDGGRFGNQREVRVINLGFAPLVLRASYIWCKCRTFGAASRLRVAVRQGYNCCIEPKPLKSRLATRLSKIVLAVGGFITWLILTAPYETHAETFMAALGVLVASLFISYMLTRGQKHRE